MAKAAPIEDEDWPRTVAAFEAWHALQPERWEFVAGRPRLMAPASMPHSVIKNNIGFAAAPGPRGQRLHRAGRRAADPDRGHLGDPGRGGDLRAARPDVAGDRGTDDHRRGHVAVDRGRRPRPQVAELPPKLRASATTSSSPSTSAWSTPTAARATSGASASSTPAASPSTTRRSRSSSTRSTPRPTSRHRPQARVSAARAAAIRSRPGSPGRRAAPCGSRRPCPAQTARPRPRGRSPGRGSGRRPPRSCAPHRSPDVEAFVQQRHVDGALLAAHAYSNPSPPTWKTSPVVSSTTTERPAADEHIGLRRRSCHGSRCPASAWPRRSAARSSRVSPSVPESCARWRT